MAACSTAIPSPPRDNPTTRKDRDPTRQITLATHQATRTQAIRKMPITANPSAVAQNVASVSPP